MSEADQPARGTARNRASRLFAAIPVRQRQYLLLGSVCVAVLAAAAAALALAPEPSVSAGSPRPTTTRLIAPGAQVDPQDAWRGQADAQLRAIEERSRGLAQRNTELEGQSRELLERLRRLESGTLTPVPPPPVAVPAARPAFGPDRMDPIPAPLPSLPPALPASASPQRLPPIPQASGGTAIAAPSTAPAVASSGAILALTLNDGPRPANTSAQAAGTPAAREAAGRYLPGGSFTRALLLGGLDAPTGGQAQQNPQPVLLKLTDHAVLPNRFRGRVRECFVVGAGYGDVSAERAYIRTETLSCVARDGSALEVPIRGYVAGEDGKAGMRGRLVSKQGQLLANALLAGVVGGLGNALQQSAMTLSVSPLGTTGAVAPGRQLEAGMGTGVGRALDRLAQYYISLAEKVFPVIEVDAGRTVDVVLTQGVVLPGDAGSGAGDPDGFQRLQERNRPQGGRPDDDD
jgi:conjugal transfer pilus assembly protein TraB